MERIHKKMYAKLIINNSKQKTFVSALNILLHRNGKSQEYILYMPMKYLSVLQSRIFDSASHAVLSNWVPAMFRSEKHLAELLY